MKLMPRLFSAFHSATSSTSIVPCQDRTVSAFGTLFAFTSVSNEAAMLRISTQDGSGDVTLKLEGKVIGDWAKELEHVWATLKPSLGKRKLRLDIRGVTFLDLKGKHVLQEIFDLTGAVILADLPLTKQFAAEAKLGHERRDGHENRNV
jgi:hypothetical protein